MIYIGIDNGVTGSIGIIDENNEYFFYKTPVRTELSYTKAKKNISRVKTQELKAILKPYEGKNVIVAIERPMVNPTRFTASISAVRALEATLIVVEELKLPFFYIDSKKWQKELLPSGIKGSTELKKASLQISLRMFPECEKILNSQKDGDALLIAKHLKNTY